MAKGATYERAVSVSLSMWWSHGKSDDLFWRTSMSGGRATIRRRKRLSTRGHAGDICATDPEGAPLTELVAIEIKRGYPSACIFDYFDRTSNRKNKIYGTWFYQARRAADTGGSPYWMILHRRDQRVPIVVIPNTFANALRSLGCVLRPHLDLEEHTALRLDDFYAAVDPNDIKILLARSKQR